jgi:uncharacterized membrane protein (UPF0127 family)
MKLRFGFGLPALLLWTAAWLSPASAVADAAPLPLSAFPRERIAVETRSARRHVFTAWRADTMETRAQGLMFVERLHPEQAMIFVYEPPQHVGMWMMNTLIPLDMLFVDRLGCVVHVHERAQPGALDTISADTPVALVVELAGGTAANLGIKVGDRVVRPDAGWPRGPATCPNNR